MQSECSILPFAALNKQVTKGRSSEPASATFLPWHTTRNEVTNLRPRSSRSRNSESNAGKLIIPQHHSAVCSTHGWMAGIGTVAPSVDKWTAGFCFSNCFTCNCHNKGIFMVTGQHRSLCLYVLFMYHVRRCGLSNVDISDTHRSWLR